MARARITPENGGQSFDAEIAELRPNSILLACAVELPFRTGALIEVANVVLDGEVVFAQNGKLALTFRTVPEIFEAIEMVDSEATPIADIEKDDAVDDAIDEALAEFTTSELVLSDVSEALAQMQPSTNQFPTVRSGRLIAKEPMDLALWCATLIAERPLAALVEGHRGPTVELALPNTLVKLQSTPMAGGWVALRAEDTAALRSYAATAQQYLGSLFGESADELGPPSFAADGVTVNFLSPQQYEREFEANLKNGALVVRSGPMDVGHRQRVVLKAPDLEPTEMKAVVTFVGDGLVGFTVEPITSTGTTGDLVSERLWRRPTDVATLLSRDTHTYFALLEELLEQEDRFVVRLEGDGQTIELWIDSGRVVFTTRTPEVEDDKIGRRLLAGRAVVQTALTGAIESNESLPLGSRLTESGRLRPKELHRFLRAQTIDRTNIPATWSHGSALLQPWREPQIEGKLLPVSSGAIRADLVRRVAQMATQEVLRPQLENHRANLVTIDLSRVSSSYRLREKEERALQRAAGDALSLDAFLRGSGLRPLEASTLLILGVGLGFITLAGGAAAARAASTTDGNARNTELMARLTRLEAANHFDVLEVHWAASHQEILAAYQRIEASVSLSHKDPKTRQLLAQIRARVIAAFEVVGKRATRVPYRNTMYDEGERKRAAAHLVEQAELEALREDANTVERLLDAAEELVPAKKLTRLRERLRRMQP